MQELQTELALIAAAGAEPISLDDAKLWLRLEYDYTDEDLLVSGLITAARSHAEMFCRRSFKVGDHWQLTLNRFPFPFGYGEGYWNREFSEVFGLEASYLLQRPDAYAITIPRGPVTSVDSITYFDTANAPQTLATANYELIQDLGVNPRVYPTYGNFWPATCFRPDAVTVSFTAGAAPVPAVLIAMKQMIAHWYGNREVVVLTGKPAEIPLVAETLMRPYRMLEL